MLLNTNISFAALCHICGRLKVHDISLFDISKNEGTNLICSCGEVSATINTKNYKSFLIEIPCFACEDDHVFIYTLKQFLKGNIISRCIETGLEIGFVGKNGDIENLISKHEKKSKKAIEELGFYDYFNNFEIIMESINEIKDMMDDDKISCECGCYDIETKLFPDRIELNCLDCNNSLDVYAETKDDLNRLLIRDTILLKRHSLISIESIMGNNDI